MEPASPEKLLEAFHVLDPEEKGFLTKEELSTAMMEEGEPFTQACSFLFFSHILDIHT